MLSVCHQLFGPVVVPDAVAHELTRTTRYCAAIRVSDYSGFIIRSATRSPAEFGVPSDLDPGESQAIALALELRADLVLIDERKGSHAARQLGLATMGVLGILVEAKQRALTSSVLPLVDRLVRELRFYVSPELRRRLAKLTNEGGDI